MTRMLILLSSIALGCSNSKAAPGGSGGAGGAGSDASQGADAQLGPDTLDGTADAGRTDAGQQQDTIPPPDASLAEVSHCPSDAACGSSHRLVCGIQETDPATSGWAPGDACSKPDATPTYGHGGTVICRCQGGIIVCACPTSDAGADAQHCQLPGCPASGTSCDWPTDDNDCASVVDGKTIGHCQCHAGYVVCGC